MPLRVMSLPEDKPKIVFHAAMMCVQNMGFFVMYYDIWGDTPYHFNGCHGIRQAVGYMALTCFCVGFLCVGMGFGGYTDDFGVFWLYWLLHLVGGASYSICTVLIPRAMYSDDGQDCLRYDEGPYSRVNGERLEYVYYLHAVLYLVYVGSMLSITYFSFAKPSFIKPALYPPVGQK